MSAFEPSGPTETIETSGSRACHVTMWFPAAGMVGAKMVGHASGDVVKRIYELIDARAGSGPPPEEGFLDLTFL